MGHTFSLDDPDRRELGATQIGLALFTEQRLMDQIPGLFSVRPPDS